MVKMLTSGDIGERNMKGTLFLQLSHVKLLQNKKFKNQLKKTKIISFSDNCYKENKIG